MNKNIDEEKEDDRNKEIFVKLLKYTTPITVAILLYVGLVTLDGEFPMIAIIFVLAVMEIIIGVKAEELYDYMNN